jgi:hypothetical protein
MFMAFFNFVGRTRGRGRGPDPAAGRLAAGVADRLMGFADLFDAVREGGYAAAAWRRNRAGVK